MIERRSSIIDNAWKVQFHKEGKLVFKKFEGNSPKASGAVDFAAALKNRGISVDVISVRRAFPPPLKDRKKPWLGTQDPPQHGLLWCPYCLKWRDFHYAAIMRETLGPEMFRCPVCTISTSDYYVKKFNPEMFLRLEIAAQVKDQMKGFGRPQRTRERRVRVRRR